MHQVPTVCGEGNSWTPNLSPAETARLLASLGKFLVMPGSKKAVEKPTPARRCFLGGRWVTHSVKLTAKTPGPENGWLDLEDDPFLLGTSIMVYFRGNGGSCFVSFTESFSLLRGAIKTHAPKFPLFSIFLDSDCHHFQGKTNPLDQYAKILLAKKNISPTCGLVRDSRAIIMNISPT